MDGQQGLILQLGVWARCSQTLPATFTLSNTCRHDASSGDKKFGGKIIPPHRSTGGSVSREASRKIHREMKLATWKVRSFYRAGSFKAAARELARYKLDVVGV